MIEEKYQQLLLTYSDIKRHLPTIRTYVSKGDVVVELGVRECVSTWALLANHPSFLCSVDIVYPSPKNLQEVVDATKKEGINFKFILGDSTKFEIESYIDVLFIDTLHFYSQLVKELWRHSEKTKKYIIFHDYALPEVNACVQDFLYNTAWEMVEIVKEDTGLAVIGRKNRPKL